MILHTTSLITVASLETNSSPDYTQTSMATQSFGGKSNKLPYLSYLRVQGPLFGAVRWFILYTMTPMALSFVRARQTLTKWLNEGVKKPSKFGGMTEWGVTLHKHTQCYTLCHRVLSINNPTPKTG